MNKKLITSALIATFACFTSAVAALPLGVYPEDVRQICSPVKKLITLQLNNQGKTTHSKRVDAKIVECLQAENIYLEKAYQNAQEKALAKVGDYDKLEEMVGMQDFGIGDPGLDIDWHDYLSYTTSLVMKWLLTLQVAEPAIKYPDQVIKQCNQAKKSKALVNPCLGYKADYMRGVMDRSLKTILAHSPNPQAIESEQKLWETSDICDTCFSDPEQVAKEKNCKNLRLILRAAESERQAKQFESGKAK